MLPSAQSPQLHSPELQPSRLHARRSAFTLIELIVVVIIIAVLAAIGAIAFNQYAAKARDAELVASATNIAHAITAKAAQDDLTTDAEAASVWPADPTGGAGDAALKKAFATSYGGTLTYVAGQPAGAAGSVDVAAASSSRHACIQLTAVTSLPATVHLGACAGLGTGPGGSTGGGLPAQCDNPTVPLLVDLCHAVASTQTYLAGNPQWAGAYTAATLPASPADALLDPGPEVEAGQDTSGGWYGTTATLADGQVIAPATADDEPEFVVPASYPNSGYCWASGLDSFFVGDGAGNYDTSAVYWYDSVLGTITRGDENPAGPAGLYYPPGGACQTWFTPPQVVDVTAAESGDNAAIPVTWTPLPDAVNTYTVTCTADSGDTADGDTGSVTVDGTTSSAVVPNLENFVLHTCQVTAVLADGTSVGHGATRSATPTVSLDDPIAGCSDLEQAPTGTTVCQTITEDPDPPVASLLPPPGMGTLPGAGLWGITSFPSDDTDAPHVFYVTNHDDGSVLVVDQTANPTPGVSTVPATVGYLFGPGTFDHPAGEITGGHPVHGAWKIDTLYVVDSGNGPGTGSVWRVDPFAHTRIKVTGGLDNPTEVTGFACYPPDTAKACLYVATDSGVISVPLRADGNATPASDTRVVTTAVASGLRLTASGKLQLSVGNAAIGVDPSTGATVSTYAVTGANLGGIASSDGAGQDLLTVQGTGAADGEIAGMDGTVYASGLVSPRDVHNHWNAPWEYFTTPSAVWIVNTSTGQVVKLWGNAPAAPADLELADTQTAGGGAMSPAFSPDGSLLVVANETGKSLSLFGVDPATGKMTPEGTTPAYNGYYPMAAAFSPDGSLLAVGYNWGSQNTLVTYKVAGGTLTQASWTPTSTSSSGVSSVAFSPSGTVVVAVLGNFISPYGTDSAGDLSPAGGMQLYSGGQVAFSPDGSYLLVGTGSYTSNQVTMLKVAAGGTLSVASSASSGTAPPGGVAFSPDGTLAVAAQSGGTHLQTYTVGAGGVLTATSTTGFSAPYAGRIAAFTPDGGRVVVMFNSTLGVYAIDSSGELVDVGSAPIDYQSGMALSSNGHVIALAHGTTVTTYTLY